MTIPTPASLCDYSVDSKSKSFIIAFVGGCVLEMTYLKLVWCIPLPVSGVNMCATTVALSTADSDSSSGRWG